MIFCSLFEVSHNPQGELLRTQKTLSGEALQIGRSAACKIHLSDYRVALHHATLTQSPDGNLHITAESSIKVNGVISQNSPLPPGSRVEIGPYLLTVDSAQSGPYVSLSLEAMEKIKETPIAERTEEERPLQVLPVSLDGLGISKRKLGYWLAGCILFLFLFLPLLPHVSPDFEKWQSSLPVTLMDSWNPGKLSKSHSVFGAQCSTCHQRAFQSVPDDACTHCHQKAGKHITDDDTHAKLFQEVRCTACHIDHKGTADLMLRHDSSLCVSCHGNIKSKKTNTTIANVHDFATDHPPFRNNAGAQSGVLSTQDSRIKLHEKSGLKYSHQLHLDKNGISSPKGDIVMTCQSCHEPDESGIHFAPVSMQKGCQQSGCHWLDFTEPAKGTAPHGSEREVMDRLRSHFVKWLAESPANLAECKLKRNADNALKLTLACANDLAVKNATSTLFRQDVECGECHEITASNDKEVPWKITPLRFNRNWHAKSVFPHGKHTASACVTCHAKTNSKSSADITMPTIEKCRECHAGERAAKGKASSSCDSCHRFHGGDDAARH